MSLTFIYEEMTYHLVIFPRWFNPRTISLMGKWTFWFQPLRLWVDKWIRRNGAGHFQAHFCNLPIWFLKFVHWDHCPNSKYYIDYKYCDKLHREAFHSDSGTLHWDLAPSQQDGEGTMDDDSQHSGRIIKLGTKAEEQTRPPPNPLQNCSSV